MSITETELQKLAKLAKLSLSAEDIPNYLGAINRLLGILKELEQVDVSELADEQKSFIVSEIAMREDVVSYHPDVEKLQKQAPETTKNFYTVPKVIDDFQEDSDV